MQDYGLQNQGDGRVDLSPAVPGHDHYQTLSCIMQTVYKMGQFLVNIFCNDSHLFFLWSIW